MSRSLAILAAVVVTFLWSTSYILNKAAFDAGVGPLTLAGLRYFVAAISLGLAHLLQQKGRRGQQGSVSRGSHVGQSICFLGLLVTLRHRGCSTSGNGM